MNYLKKSLLFTLIILIATLSILFFSPIKNHVSASAERISGLNRYETSIKISREGWMQSTKAVLATGENFPDALCSAPLAKKYNAPILLTPKDTLGDPSSGEYKLKDELTRLGVKEIFIIGGMGVISEKVEQELQGLGVLCTRIFGEDRYETSIKVAERLDNFTDIVVTTGTSFPDALSIASVAAKKGMPILLSPQDNLPIKLKSYLQSKKITTSYLIGGIGALSDNLKTEFVNPIRLSGKDRYETNIALLNYFESELDFTKTYIATGELFPDALSGSALAAVSSSSIILTNALPSETTKSFILKKINASNIQIKILGGEGAVPSSALENLLSSGFQVLSVE